MYKNKKSEGAEQLSFNMAMDYTMKIALYLDQFETLWSNGQLKPAMWRLKKVWHKLSPYLSKPEDDYIEKAFNSMQRMFINGGNRGIINLNLERLARHISRKLKDRGLLIPLSDDTRFLFRRK